MSSRSAGAALPPLVTKSRSRIRKAPRAVLAFQDLAPAIHRQRLVVEGYPAFVITDVHIKEYLLKLSVVTDMITIIEPVTHVSERYGWAGWIHWETSGAHFYAWEQPMQFFSVDIYTCKPFDVPAAIDFTASFFGTDRIAAKVF